MKARLADLGAEPMLWRLPNLANLSDKWGKVITAANIKAK
jgi:hypothetical protein